MYRRSICLLLVSGFCLTSSLAHATTIVWVSDNKTPADGVPADQGWVDLLEAYGYAVNLDFRNQEGRTLDAAKIAALNEADLIIVGRDTNSGDYASDATEVDQWNSIKAPILLLIGHITRSNRWRWLNTTGTNDPGIVTMEVVDIQHPVFQDVEVGEDNQVEVVTIGPSFANATEVGNGRLIARRADNGEVWIAEWEPGVEFYAGAGQSAPSRRMYFSAGSNSGIDGRYNLTPEGEQMFINAVNYMLGTLVREPWVKAWKPTPADGATGVTSPLLQWTPGETAVLHDIYVSTNPDLGPDSFMIRQTLALYWHAPGLTAGTTYYWRVDEVEIDATTVHAGDVWSFTVAPLEAYAPKPRDGAKWVGPDVELTWSPGQNAISHGVYFGMDQAAVAARDPATFRGTQAAIKYAPGTLQTGATYYWLVDENDTVGATHEGELWSFTVIGPGGGVKGEYFANSGLLGDPAVTRIDPRIDFSWPDGTTAGTNSPAEGIPTDGFSCRWTADLQVDHTDTYRLVTTSDDGVRLYLDGALVVNNWTDHEPTDNRTARLELVPGRVYSLQMEMYENTGGAVAQLSWESSSDERQTIPRGPLQPPLHAGMPSPANGAADVAQDVRLSWSAGDEATGHQVYFGDDEATVAGATTGTPQALDNTTYNPGVLAWGTSYYWRVDEVRAAGPLTGSVWSFTTADFLIVEDFESYDDDMDGGTAIYQTWIDGVENGTGSYVGYPVASNGTFGETIIVHGGTQSMPLDYNNVDPPYYSETERTFLAPENWTVNGVDTLVIHIRGRAGNDAEPLYVGVEDSAGRAAFVVHPDAAIVTTTTWTQWRILLSEFTAAGVSPTAVKKMIIGLGNRDAPIPGGAGRIYIDDVRVMQPEPVE